MEFSAALTAAPGPQPDVVSSGTLGSNVADDNFCKDLREKFGHFILVDVRTGTLLRLFLALLSVNAV